MEIHHIGYLVKKIKKAILEFEKLGFHAKSSVIFDEIRNVDICFMEKDGYTIELVSPTDENSVVYGMMKRFKNSPYHICYKTTNFEEEYNKLTENGYITIDTPTQAPALSGKRVVFLINPSIGMIELLEN